MLFKDRLLGLRRMAMLLHEVADGKLLLIVASSCFLHHFCVISCVKPHYFRSALRFAFLCSGFHSCPHTVHITVVTRKCRTLWERVWASWYRNIMSLMSDVTSSKFKSLFSASWHNWSLTISNSTPMKCDRGLLTMYASSIYLACLLWLFSLLFWWCSLAVVLSSRSRYNLSFALSRFISVEFHGWGALYRIQ